MHWHDVPAVVRQRIREQAEQEDRLLEKRQSGLLCRVNELYDKVDELRTEVEALTRAVTVTVDP